MKRLLLGTLLLLILAGGYVFRDSLLQLTDLIGGKSPEQKGARPAVAQAVVAGDTWPIGGDLIVKADGQTIGSLERLRDVIAAKKPGDSLQLEIYRGTKKMTVDARLGRQ